MIVSTSFLVSQRAVQEFGPERFERLMRRKLIEHRHFGDVQIQDMSFEWRDRDVLHVRAQAVSPYSCA